MIQYMMPLMMMKLITQVFTGMMGQLEGTGASKGEFYGDTYTQIDRTHSAEVEGAFAGAMKRVKGG